MRGMITAYIAKAMELAQYKTLEDGQQFGEIPGFLGVWANGKDNNACNEELQEVLEEWLLLKLQDQDDDIPIVDGIDLATKRQRA